MQIYDRFEITLVPWQRHHLTTFLFLAILSIEAILCASLVIIKFQIMEIMGLIKAHAVVP